MIGCIESLIKKLEEETMECLCKLLTTIGKDLEKNYNINLQTYFNEMKTIAEDKNNKLNSRIRFDIFLSQYYDRLRIFLITLIIVL